MDYYLIAWKRGFDFSGRSSREAFWMFMLVHFLVTFACIAFDIAFDTWFDAIYSIISFIPMIAAMVRRLHDTDRSGGWVWIFLVPVVGPFWLVYLLIQTKSDNREMEGFA